MKLFAYLPAVAVCLGVAPALAQDIGGKPAYAQSLGLSELRGGAMIDDTELYGFYLLVPRSESVSLANLSAVSFDALFMSPDLDAFRWIGSPRPTVGLTYDYRHESMLHASLTWHLPIFSTGLFAEAEVGGAVHNGALSGATAPFRNLGCPALFYYGLNFGYQVNEHWSVMATAQHGSQYGFCGWDNNQGLNYDGVRIGYKF